MRTVVIIADSDPRKKVIGGIGIYAYNLTRYLTTHNHKVIFIGKKHDCEIINNFDNFEFVEATAKHPSSNIAFLKGLYVVSRMITMPEDAVIHSQRPDWLIPFSKLKNKKIITLHGSHAKNVYLKKGLIFGKIYSFLEKKGLKLADKIISVSEENANYYRKMYEKDKKICDKIITIPIGVDLSRFNDIDKAKARKKYSLSLKDKAVCYVGRLEAEKNVKVIIKASKEADVKLLIFGDGKESEHLKTYAKEISSNAMFFGSIPNDDVPSALACSDALCLSSLYEGLPTVAIEALASGIPVVSTDVGDIRKLVVEGFTGFIANAENYSEKIKLAIARGKDMQKDCLAKASEYDMERIGEEIVKVYGE
ncbi:MAG: glycosyltransferase family 4 protein [archaeon]